MGFSESQSRNTCVLRESYNHLKDPLLFHSLFLRYMRTSVVGTKGLLIRMVYICPMISQKFYLRHTLNPKILMEQDALYQQLLLAI